MSIFSETEDQHSVNFKDSPKHEIFQNKYIERTFKNVDDKIFTDQGRISVEMNFKEGLKEEIFNIMDEKILTVTEKIDNFKRKIDLEMRTIKQINFNAIEPNQFRKRDNFKQSEDML